MARLKVCLSLQAIRGVGPVKIRRLFSAFADRNLDPEQAHEDEAQRVLQEHGVPLPAADVDAAEQQAQELVDKGITCFLPQFDPLGRSADRVESLPPILFARGPAELLSRVGVGFCGSRRATPRGIEVAQDVADQLAHLRVNVVSGGARGVDTAAHGSALAAGGTTTIVLAEGILRFSLRRELKAVYDPERTLVVSEFPPQRPWQAGQAMTRNQTICALSRAMVLIEAGTKGGTFNAGLTSLKLGVPLYSVDYANQLDENSGNRILLGKGAQPLRKSASTHRANLSGLLSAVAEEESRPQSTQTSLWSSPT
ncbi:MAG: DNA-processing protein DprA [Planctomycetes bacterium]|nr:DNA-processing protein DprA [Planctomycetota bacterium]